MRVINITGLKVFANHGVNQEEKENGQNFYIDAHLYPKNNTLDNSDDIDNTVSYSDVCKFIVKIVAENTWDLIETVAENIAKFVLLEYPKLEAVEVEVCKPEAPMKCEFENVSVSVYRQWHNAVVAIGSNIGDKQNFLNQGLEQIKSNSAIKDLKVSSIIKTEPYGDVEQDDFLNGACIFKTLLTPEELLSFLQKTELDAGRVRDIHWGPRTLDLDIIFYDREIIHTENLIVPHYDMANRDFVLNPLNELIPNFIHPVTNKSIFQMLKELNTND